MGSIDQLVEVVIIIQEMRFIHKFYDLPSVSLSFGLGFEGIMKMARIG